MCAGGGGGGGGPGSRALGMLNLDYQVTLSHYLPGRMAQSVTCLTTDASQTADPGVASSIPAGSHTFMENDYEIISLLIQNTNYGRSQF